MYDSQGYSQNYSESSAMREAAMTMNHSNEPSQLRVKKGQSHAATGYADDERSGLSTERGLTPEGSSFYDQSGQRGSIQLS